MQYPSRSTYPQPFNLLANPVQLGVTVFFSNIMNAFDTFIVLVGILEIVLSNSSAVSVRRVLATF